MADLTKYMSKNFTFHRVKIEEIENGLRITETFDSDIVESFISFNAKPFFRSTNETGAETYQVLDVIGEIYNIPALATDFILIDLKGTVYIPGNATELIEYSVKLKPFRSFYELDAVLSIGEITADSSTVTVGLSSTGKNSVKINGSIYDRYILSDFPFIPVVEFTKILIVYAKPDNTVFYLAQGVEALSAVEPDYEGLFVARIIASIDGNIIEYPNYGVITEDSDTVAFTGNGTTLEPLVAEVKDVYSTTETKTGGTWIDGKPIYRKTHTFTTLAGINIFFTGIFDDIETITYDSMFTDWTSDNGVMFSGRQYDLFRFDISTTYLTCINTLTTAGQDISVFDSITLTLEYTKTP